MSKKIACLLLAVMLCVGLLPFGALAEAEEETVIVGEEVLDVAAEEEVTDEEVPAVTEEEIAEEAVEGEPEAEASEEIDPENIIEILPVPEPDDAESGLHEAPNPGPDVRAAQTAFVSFFANSTQKRVAKYFNTHRQRTVSPPALRYLLHYEIPA